MDGSTKGKGPVRVGYFNDIQCVCSDFVQACTKVGVPLSHDFNTNAGTIGVNRVCYSLFLFWKCF